MGNFPFHFEQIQAEVGRGGFRGASVLRCGQSSQALFVHRAVAESRASE